MRNKSKLSVVGSGINLTAPPSNLGKTGAGLWRTLMDEYAIDDAGGLEILQQCCAAADRAAECAAIIDRDGHTVRTAQSIKDHPLLIHELAARSFVTRSLHRLGLDIEPLRPTTGRPPGRGPQF